MTSEKEDATLWIGGTSSLARTFFVNYDHVVKNPPGDWQPNRRKWILTGLERDPPQWITALPKIIPVQYISLNLTGMTTAEVNNFLVQLNDNDFSNISSIVFSIRPFLFDKYIYTDVGDRMVKGLKLLMQHLVVNLPRLHFILHISSVAAADHLRTQAFAKETDLDPPLTDYTAPYDRCKRQSEDIISSVCHENNLSCIHLRLSAIFSDDRGCIQCSALSLQGRVGCYLPLAIDCNSSLNVSKAVYVLLGKSGESPMSQSQQSVYYYTRPLTLPKPVPYGYYLSEFRRAHDIDSPSIWVPLWMVTSFVTLVHWLAHFNQRYLARKVPYLDAADYLLQVAAREHSFDNGAFRELMRNEIEQAAFTEETILDCFKRRKIHLNERN
ncbi:hypothetical protein IV203_008619 [Nitzschia inconspicua]|uniref:Uncharacterized protein n=1 Tax=Nitzschia inconspicua TaxID=303405 RepID=A0A9K3PMV3_9STRA|nr:hypothetical protein IV203_008619 [Nitzschia inconspicua]